ncbi:MAG: malonyl-CoA decarboxylase [Betaproteobacteria bacterium]|nr:malonyl-CoA decarboxylase [Betaproteobacteria bacterium]
MNKVNWLTAAIAKFSPKPSNLVAKEIPADVAKPSSTRRNTAERLAATLKQQHEAMSPRLLRRSFQALQAVIDPSISEIEGGKRAQQLALIYSASTRERKLDFWRLMAEQFGTDKAKAELERLRYEAAQGSSEELAAEVRYRRATVSPRRRLLQRFANFPHGLQFLIEMRAELQPLLKSERQLAALDLELEYMLGTWCDISFLELRAINWDSPASLIERLIKYEAVHDIRSWSDVKKRLESDRRCYGFFHPRMPGIPLIFIEVALMNAVPSAITPVIDEDRSLQDQKSASVAVFYSISNTQAGLRGIPFGDSLIKRVVEELTIDFPRLKTFVTLSPIPGYRQWLSRQLDDQWPLIDEKAIKAFDATLPIGSSSKDAFISLSDALIRPNPDSPKQADAIKTIHLQLAARYLSQLDQHNEPVDPVARFHLGNGARIERLNWLADPSPKGLKQSYGLMINYLYDLKRLDRARSGLAKGKIAMSPEVESLLKS